MNGAAGRRCAGRGLLAEPINAASNAAFLLAAWLLWRLARQRGALSAPIGLLLGLIVATGVGRTLFHTYATGWARWLDELPILLFQLAFLWFYARAVLHWPRVSAAALVVELLVAAFGARGFPQFLNGSVTYAPAIGAIFALGPHHWLKCREEPPLLLAAAGAFTLSLVLRAVDDAVCAAFPVGSHFLWHLLNAVVIYLAVRSIPPRTLRASQCETG
jgi:hypothetical protein